MRDQFPGYYQLSEEDFKELWGNATFVFDANVLLNLYRYPQQASDDLISAITQLKGNIWLPHSVALEYQRNRLQVIAEQLKTYSKVRDAINNNLRILKIELDKFQLNKRHSSIEVETFIQELETAKEKFFSTLESLESQQSKPQDTDAIRDKIDELFMGKIGSPPSNQKDLDAIYQAGQERYSKKIPPGYMDADKDKGDKNDSFQYGTLVYQRKFGDYLLWIQLLDFAKTHELKHVVLVTDDEKEDWWWIVDSQGKKKIGPRPELVREIYDQVGVELFYIYNTENFLRWCSKFLEKPVPKESITQVEDIKYLIHEKEIKSSLDIDSLKRLKVSKKRIHQNKSEQTDRLLNSVLEWILKNHSKKNVRINSSFPDFIVRTSNGREGITPLYCEGLSYSYLNSYLLNLSPLIEEAIEYSRLKSLTLILCFETESSVYDFMDPDVEKIRSNLNYSDKINIEIAFMERSTDCEYASELCVLYSL